MPSTPSSMPAGACRAVNAFSKGSKLGEGTYGSVYMATDKASGQRVALKRVKLSDSGFDREGMPITSLREISLLRRLSHRNVVELLEVVVGNRADAVFLVFEFCAFDLARLIDTMERPFSQGEVKWMMAELLRAVTYLHANHVMHRDLKMSNLLLSDDGTLKVCDFGLARTCQGSSHSDNGPYTPRVVTLWYRAPELLLGAISYGPAVDMWSVGCIMGELLLHRPLLPAATELAQMQAICELLGTPSLRIWPDVSQLPLWGKLRLPDQPYNDLPAKFAKLRPSEATLELLNSFLTFDPQKRIASSAALAHAYVGSPVPRAERPRSHLAGAKPVSASSTAKRPRLAEPAAAAHLTVQADPLLRARAQHGSQSTALPMAQQAAVRIPSPCEVAVVPSRWC